MSLAISIYFASYDIIRPSVSILGMNLASGLSARGFLAGSATGNLHVELIVDGYASINILENASPSLWPRRAPRQKPA